MVSVMLTYRILELQSPTKNIYCVSKKYCPFYIVTYNMTWVTTSWTHSTAGINRHPIFIVYSLDKNGQDFSDTQNIAMDMIPWTHSSSTARMKFDTR